MSSQSFTILRNTVTDAFVDDRENFGSRGHIVSDSGMSSKFIVDHKSSLLLCFIGVKECGENLESYWHFFTSTRLLRCIGLEVIGTTPMDLPYKLLRNIYEYEMHPRKKLENAPGTD